MTATTQARRGTWQASGLSARSLWILTAHALAMTAVLTPLLLVQIPPLVDYLDHLARMSILATIGERPALQEFYRVDWALLPNLAMDLTVPLLGQAIGIELAGKLFVMATLLSIAAGTALLHYAVHRRLEPWPLAIYLFLYCGIFAYGFLNYLFGIGLSLILFALWIITRDWPAHRRLPLFVVGAPLLFLCHLAAIASFAVCIGGYELWRWHGSRERSPARLLQAAAEAALPFLLPILLVILASPTPAGAPDIQYLWAEGKIGALLTPFSFMHQPLDPLLAVATLCLALLGLHSGSLRLAAPLLLPAALFALAILAVPTWLYDNWGNDRRLAIPLLAVLIAAMHGRVTLRQGALIGTLALSLFAVRMTTVALDWPRYDAMFAEFRRAAAALPPASRLASAIDMGTPVSLVAPRSDRRPFYHLAALALLDRDIFVPTLFTAEGRQVLSVQAAYRAIDVPHAKPIPKAHLRDLLEPGRETAALDEDTNLRHVSRFAGWSATFDYLLLIDFGQRENPVPRILRPFRQGSYFTLYEIRRPAAQP